MSGWEWIIVNFRVAMEEVEAMFQAYVKQSKVPIEQVPKAYIPAIKGMFTRRPFY